ncbi:FAD:protein FMN transferase [Polynucleobacter sp. AP-Melu-500A-A1]|uniref:FAD:protein FMN transferase n=1 Tax=Polynucleobacter sp. AP-Melu-500A-A1 TaxID=2576929 RepID=UPI001C0E83D5|nr:FAD:protein FMN transferase [Polynucleobacter sp. AP-Melu-500A-A1]MBU3631378.1 FAD:protein FMN transferase [Polynucleobacter sp. AP-Melu-500A-A1]
MRRCKPLLGTYVEISIQPENGAEAISLAFSAIVKVQNLMSFHDQYSELSIINREAHLRAIAIDPWTSQIIRIAQDIHQYSGGLFNCGIGHRLVEAKLLPGNIDIAHHDFGGIENLQFVSQDCVISSLPLCLDLGGIAKGFAVDMAVNTLKFNGIHSGSVNAGGDMRIFGNEPQAIHIRNPKVPSNVIEIGSLMNGAIATSGLYFFNRDQQQSYIINPLADKDLDTHHVFSESFSIIANECVYADALTKVLALSKQQNHPCFERYQAQAIQIAV